MQISAMLPAKTSTPDVVRRLTPVARPVCNTIAKLAEAPIGQSTHWRGVIQRTLGAFLRGRSALAAVEPLPPQRTVEVCEPREAQLPRIGRKIVWHGTAEPL